MKQVKGQKMAPEPRTARQIFDELYADGDRPRFGFGKRLAILNVDLQRAYTDIDHFDSAYETDPCQISHINRLSRLARERGMPVVWTRVDELSGSDPSGVFSARRPGSEGQGPDDRPPERWDFDPRCAIDASRDAIYAKRMPSAFFGTPLIGWLVWRGVDTVVVTGGSTSGCVRATAVDSVSYGFRTIVPLECVADRNEGRHCASLCDLMQNYADVEPVQTVVDWLEGQG
jgi:maleamate amidohydrolase